MAALREAAYTSPSGRRLEFDYEDVSKAFTRKTVGFDPCDTDGTYIQDNGKSGRKLPLTVIFWGSNCDEIADLFEELVSERGVGTLEHPRYGVIECVPYGDIERKDGIVREGNQVTINITFWEAVGAAYPTAGTDKALSVVSAVTAFNEAAAVTFSEQLSEATVAEESGLRGALEALAGGVERGLSTVAAGETAFQDIHDSVVMGLDTMVGDPLTLAFQSLLLIQAPARSAAEIDAKMDAYISLLRDITIKSYDSLIGFMFADLSAAGIISAMTLFAVSSEFYVKSKALAVAETIFSQFDAYVAWRDGWVEHFEANDVSSAYMALRSAVSVCAGYLVEISFTLKREKSIILESNRHFIELCWELNGSVSGEALDFFISSNSLTGDEMIEIKKGRSIVYYV